MSSDVKIMAKCLNCETKLIGKFCYHCGQDATIHLHTLKSFLADFFEKVVGFDHRALLTLKILFLKPGQLAKDICAGRRQRYYSPVKLYFFSSLLFFLLLGLVPGMQVQASWIGLQIRTSAEQKWELKSAIGIRKVDEKFKLLDNMSNEEKKNVIRYGVVAHAAQALLFLIPLSAILLSALYPKSIFEEHLVFSVTFFMAALLFLVLGLYPVSIGTSELINNGLIVVIILYAYRSFRVFYGENRLKTIFKLAAFTYALVLSLTFSLVVAISFQT